MNRDTSLMKLIPLRAARYEMRDTKDEFGNG